MQNYGRGNHLLVPTGRLQAWLADPADAPAWLRDFSGGLVRVDGGPARVEAGLNSSHGALGSGSAANATIGRALKLVLQNVGGARLGGTDRITADVHICVSS